MAVVGQTTEALLFEMRTQLLDRRVDRTTGEVTDAPRYAKMSQLVGLAWTRLYGFRRQGGAWLRVELSLPKMLNGHNRNVLDRRMLVDAVDAALTVLAEDLPDVPKLGDLRLQRLDLARDFHGVQCSSTALEAFSHRHIPYARYFDPRRGPDGALESLTRGSRSEYLVRGYDKARELLASGRKSNKSSELNAAWAAVSHGQLRFEVELKARALRRRGLIRMADLDARILDDVAREYFHLARWDDPYGGKDRVQRTLEELRPTLSAAEYRNLCNYIFWTERGLEVELSRNALERVRPIARRHNLLDPDDDREARQLDFDTGREVSAD